MVKVKFDYDGFEDDIFNFAVIKNIYEDDFIGHYTDINGLKGVLDDGGMRLCHFGYMNDPNDSVYLIDALKKEIFSRLKGTSLELHALNVLQVDSSPLNVSLKDEVADTLPDFTIENEESIIFEILKTLTSHRDGMYKMRDLPSIYICSFSSLGKRASHSGAIHSEGINSWRTYGNDGAGYRIDFCAAELINNVKVDGADDAIGFYYIRYMSEPQVSKCAKNILDLVQNIIIDNKHALNYDNFIDLLVEINNGICFLSSLIKSNHYRQEGEVRCVYFGPVNKSKISHYIRDDYFVPYVNMKFNSKGLISNIVCGPVVPVRSVYSLIDFVKSKRYRSRYEDWSDFILKSKVIYKRKELF